MFLQTHLEIARLQRLAKVCADDALRLRLLLLKRPDLDSFHIIRAANINARRAATCAKAARALMGLEE